MTEVSLRPATAADVPRLSELVRGAYAHYVMRLGEPPRPMTDDYAEVVRTHRVIVAERGGEILGLAVLGVDEEGFFIDNVAVDPSHQGLGVGKALLEHAESAARDAGFDSIYLYTHEQMVENLALYGRIGYVEYDRRPVGGGQLVYLRKNLGPSPQPARESRLAELIARVRAFGRRHRALIAVVGSLATAAVLVLVLAGRREEFEAAISDATAGVLAVTVLLQIVALLARSEAWHLTIQAAGGTVARRVLYRASSMQVLGSILNTQLGVAARIAALRRSSPEVSPQVPTLIAAEFPILAVEAVLAALSSFTLVAPLGLPWWLPIGFVAVIGTASAGLRHLALRKGRELWSGLAVLRKLGDGSRVVGLIMVAVFAQIFRNWLLLHAVGVDASFFDAIAVLIAVVTLGQLPVGPAAGAAAAVLILGSDGVAAAAAAGVLMTVTGTVGGLCFAAWAGADQLGSAIRGAWLRRSRSRASESRQ